MTLYTTFPRAEIRHIDSQVATMRMFPPIKMHDDFNKEHVVYRERLFDSLSLGLALLSKIIVNFYTSDSDKLRHLGQLLRRNSV